MGKKKKTTEATAPKTRLRDLIAGIIPADVALNDILTDPRFQTRMELLNEAAVEEYREIYADSGEKMEAIILVRIKGKLFLAAGFQRLEAARRAGCKTIRAIVVDGDEETAMIIALDSNHHGLKLTGGDKKKAIRMAIETFPTYSNVRIAELIGCVESYVRKIRESEDSQVRTGANLNDRSTGKDNKSYPRRKSGKSKPSESENSTSEAGSTEKDDAIHTCTQAPATPKRSELKAVDPPAEKGEADAVSPTSDDVEKNDSADEDRVAALLAQIRESYEGCSKDEQESLMEGLYEFLCDAGYIESAGENNDAESDNDNFDDEESDDPDVEEDGDEFDDSDMIEDDDFDDSDLSDDNEEEEE